MNAKGKRIWKPIWFGGLKCSNIASNKSGTYYILFLFLFFLKNSTFDKNFQLLWDFTTPLKENFLVVRWISCWKIWKCALDFIFFFSSYVFFMWVHECIEDSLGFLWAVEGMLEEEIGVCSLLFESVCCLLDVWCWAIHWHYGYGLSYLLVLTKCSRKRFFELKLLLSMT